MASANASAFGGGGDVDAAQELVDELDLLPVARLRADERGAPRHRVQQRAHALDGRLGAAHHDQQVPVGGARDAAGHGRVDHVDLPAAVAPSRHRRGADRGHDHHGRARLEGAGRVALAEQHASTCSGVATISTSTSTPEAASATAVAASTPSPASACARLESMSYATIACPARATHAAIGAPIAPRPIQPIRVIRGSWTKRPPGVAHVGWRDPSVARSRSMKRWILPVAVIGQSVTNSMWRGTL